MEFGAGRSLGIDSGLGGPTLLARFSLHGAVLECKHDNCDAIWERWLSFSGLDQYKDLLHNGDYVWGTEILAAGLVPISYEQNGDIWGTSIKDGLPLCPN